MNLKFPVVCLFIFLIGSQKLLCKQLDSCLLELKLLRSETKIKILCASFCLLMLFFPRNNFFLFVFV